MAIFEITNAEGTFDVEAETEQEALAAMGGSQEVESPVSAPFPLVDTSQPEQHPDQVQASTDLEMLQGFGEVALTMGTGAFSAIAAGIGGITESVSATIRGDESPLDAAEDRISAISEENTFIPKSQEGKDILRTLGIPFQAFEKFADEQGNKTLKATGSPAAAAAIKTAIISSPDLFGLKGVKLRAKQRGDVKGLEAEADQIGLTLEETPAVQREQLIANAKSESGSRVAKGQDMTELQSSVIEARDITKAEVNNLYAQARDEGGSISVAQASEFSQIARESLKTFDVDDMSTVSNRLTELDQISTLPKGSSIKLEAIDNFRKKLQKDRVASTDLPQQTALGIMKGQLDEFMDAQFNADMINGSPEALAKWKDARKASASYKERFKDNKIIRQLGDQQATPEEIRSWVFGANKLGFKKEAGDVVRRLKGIVGEDSPQFNALRQDALLNVLDPLLKDTPNLQQFARVYDDLIKNNPTITKELFPDSATSLTQLRKFAGAIDKNKNTPIPIKIEETISRALVGHQIAKATIRVTLLGNVLKLMRRMGGKTQRARVLGEILGYDPDAPVIPFKPALIGGAVQTGIDQGGQEELQPLN